MDTRFIINFDFRNKSGDIQFSDVIEHFNHIIKQTDELLQTKNNWYETGFSRKQAMNQIAFQDGNISKNTRAKWERRYKNDYPLFVDGVWNAADDAHSCGISYRKMFYDERNRASVELSVVPKNESELLTRLFSFMSRLVSLFDCSYMSVDSKGYSVLRRSVFPDRLSVGWMLYIPHIVFPELIPDAARVVAVMDHGKQKGTIIVSTNDMFDGSNKEHIAKANDIEIILLDLGFLPLISEL